QAVAGAEQEGEGCAAGNRSEGERYEKTDRQQARRQDPERQRAKAPQEQHLAQTGAALADPAQRRQPNGKRRSRSERSDEADHVGRHAAADEGGQRNGGSIKSGGKT